MIYLTIAQIANDAANAVSPLYAYGPLGIICGFFMLVFHRVMVARDHELLAVVKQLVAEVHNLAHDVEGLRRAMLADVIDRDTSGHHAKNFAKRELAKIEARTEMRR